MSWDSKAAGADDWNKSGNHVAEFENGNATNGASAVDEFNGGNGGDFASGGAYGDNDGGANDRGADDGGCRNCGQDGHFARDCPEPRKMGACFNCGEEGHSKVDCTQPRKFTGTCNECQKEDRFSSRCNLILADIYFYVTAPLNGEIPLLYPVSTTNPYSPDRVLTCKNCHEEGHEALKCTANRKLSMHHVADKVPDEAWEALKEASDDRDIADFKDAVQVLVKACPDITYVELEKECRERGFNVYLIAMEKDHGDTFTVVNLQGQIGKKFTVSYFLSDKPQRPSMKERWPTSSDDNITRLEDAGIPMDRGIMKCGNCNELGHGIKSCPQEREVFDRTVVKCALCDEEGHRVRDCQQERKKPRAPKECRVCQGTDHMAKDCPNREIRTCKNCGSEDHLAKECDKPRPCRNCDATDHISKDCPKPKDWSRVKCKRCGNMGHTVVRCKEPPTEEESGNAENGGGLDANNGGFDANNGGAVQEYSGGAAAENWEGGATTDYGSAAPVTSSAGDGW